MKTWLLLLGFTIVLSIAVGAAEFTILAIASHYWACALIGLAVTIGCLLLAFWIGDQE